jgi:hypothetical protein
MRFCDESTGDHNKSYHTVFQSNARALLLWDRRVHERHATVSAIPGLTNTDKFAVAIEHGGEGAVCSNQEEVRRFADANGFDEPESSSHSLSITIRQSVRGKR